jgi:DeoR/GlpR family transcriptional regulator of sugar metabolism
MVAQAGETAVIAAPDKLGAVSPFTIAPLTDVDTLVVAEGSNLDLGSWSGEVLLA